MRCVIQAKREGCSRQRNIAEEGVSKSFEVGKDLSWKGFREEVTQNKVLTDE